LVDKVTKAIKQKKDEIVIAKGKRAGIFLNRFASGLLRKIVIKVDVRQTVNFIYFRQI